MEKEYYPKLGLIFLVILVLLSPFGLFIYALYKVIEESILTFSANILDFFSYQDFFFSIAISLTATLCAVLVGSFISFYLIYIGKTKFKYNILNIVLVLPHLGFAYIVYLFFSDQGFLFRALGQAGIDVGLTIINDEYGIGIILNYMLKEVPFVILYLLATTSKDMNGHIFAAKDLGASILQIFTKIFLPLSSVQIITITIVIFAFVLGNYEIPFLLGGNSPQFLSVSALNNFQSIDPDQNGASYLKVTVIFTISVIMSIILRIYGRYIK